jgi:predicted transcriptional regulator
MKIKEIPDKILISINPAHVTNILNGTKQFEYRTKVAKNDIKSIIVYSTSPTKKVVAEVEITNILSLNPEELWKQTENYSGINKEYFDKYFFGREKAYAYVLGKVTCFDDQKNLIDYNVRFAPQSFVYIS